MKCIHGQCKEFAFGAQCNLYSTDSRWGFCITQRKRYQHVGIFALGDAKVPNANGFVSQWNIGFIVRVSSLIPEFMNKNFFSFL